MSRGPYTNLGRGQIVKLPFSVCRKLHEIGTLSAKENREYGGYVSLKDFRVSLEKGKPGTNHNTYIPSQRSLSIRNVLRYHSHPATDFQTPPSYQDLLQICKDYVQRNDGVPCHLVITPKAFFILYIPKQILYHLDDFNGEHKRMSGAVRKESFVRSEFFRKHLEPFCKQLKKYQTCGGSYDHACVRKFLKTLDDKYGVKIIYKPYREKMCLGFTVYK